MPVDTARDTTIQTIRDSRHTLIRTFQSPSPPVWHIPKIRHVFSTRYGRHYYRSHCFHTKTGMRLSRYIHAERVKQAQVLMRDSELNISGIAYACGYRDPSHFSRSFCGITGNAPKAWRRETQ